MYTSPKQTGISAPSAFMSPFIKSSEDQPSYPAFTSQNSVNAALDQVFAAADSPQDYNRPPSNVTHPNHQRSDSALPSENCLTMSLVSAALRKKFGGAVDISTLHDKVTHIHLNAKNLRSLVSSGAQRSASGQVSPNKALLFLSKCPGLTHVYLDNNSLDTVEGISHLHSLTSLHLHNNRLSSTADIGVPGLSQLYVPGNNISVVHLPHTHNLAELSLANQRTHTHALTPEELCFTRETTQTLGQSLMLLDLSHNRLTDLEALTNDPRYGSICELEELRVLDLSGNELSSVAEVVGLVKHLPHLNSLSCANNPVARDPLYRRYVIMLCPRLTQLDGKAILPNERQFYQAQRSHKRDVQEGRERLSAGQTRTRKDGGLRAVGSTVVQPPLPHQQQQPQQQQPSAVPYVFNNNGRIHPSGVKPGYVLRKPVTPSHQYAPKTFNTNNGMVVTGVNHNHDHTTPFVEISPENGDIIDRFMAKAQSRQPPLPPRRIHIRETNSSSDELSAMKQLQQHQSQQRQHMHGASDGYGFSGQRYKPNNAKPNRVLPQF